MTLRVSFRFDGLAVVNVAQRAFHLLISALNITMSQRKSVLYVSNITSMALVFNSPETGST